MAEKWELVHRKTIDGPPRQIDKVSVLTFNIWGEDDSNAFLSARMQHLLRIVLERQADILCFQEMTEKAFECVDAALRSAYPYCSDDVLDSNVLKERNSNVTNVIYSKVPPLSFCTYKIGGALDYDNVASTCVFGNAILVNVHFQAGCPQSSDKRRRALADACAQCRQAQFRALVAFLDETCPSRSAIVCGDFNAHLDGGDSWPEIDGSPVHGWLDTFRQYRPNQPGWTEDTQRNTMRWNLKFKSKQYRYDGIFVRGDTPKVTESRLVGTEPFLLSRTDSQAVIDCTAAHQRSQLKLCEGRLAWFVSDHFGVMSTVEL